MSQTGWFEEGNSRPHEKPSVVYENDLTPYISKSEDNSQYVAGGAFGDIYKCRYTKGSESKEVAVKALRFKVMVDGDASDKCAKMLRREIGIWKRLDHANIVPFLGTVRGFGMKDSTSFVSLWMSNESLHAFLVKHDDKLTVTHRLQLLLDIANGLHYLHSLPIPIVHGDLNPNNVLIDANYTARLADFGYSSFMGDIPDALAYLQRSTTRPGALYWSSPEQIQQEGMSTKSDVYSFGCVGLQAGLLVPKVACVLTPLEVLSGKRPWSEVRGETAVILCSTDGKNPDRPESRAIDDSHWDVIRQCWSPIGKRPAAKVIVSVIQEFLGCCPSSLPLHNLLKSSPSVDNTDHDDQTRLPPRYPSSDTPLSGSFRSTLNSTPKLNAYDTVVFVNNPDYDNQTRFSHRYPSSNVSVSRLFQSIFGSTFKLNADDIVVFIAGPSGGGKSWFTQAVTGSNDLVEVGRTLEPRTKDVVAIRCQLNGAAKHALRVQDQNHIVFVDTPSLLTETGEDAKAEENTRLWLKKSRSKSALVGTIYVDRIANYPHIEPAIQKVLDCFALTFPTPQEVEFQCLPLRLRGILSYNPGERWIKAAEIKSRKANFQEKLRGVEKSHFPRRGNLNWDISCHPECFEGDEGGEAWKAVVELFSTRPDL